MTRFFHGLWSLLSILGALCGSWWCRSIAHLSTSERRSRGLVLILPGIEGHSALNLGLARGLDDGGVDRAIEVFDWTSGYIALSLWHLCDRKRHHRESARLARYVEQYSAEQPDAPIYLIGHSGGCGIIAEALRQLDDRTRVRNVVMLAPAVSYSYDLEAALSKSDRGIWNFYSWGDFIQLAAGTLLFGTIDRRHSVSAGLWGFRSNDSRLHQIGYGLAMARSWHVGGHYGYVNRVFAADWLAPLVSDHVPAAQ